MIFYGLTILRAGFFLSTSFFLLFILFFFIGPVEEVNSYYGLIIGLTYNLFINKEFVNEKI